MPLALGVTQISSIFLLNAETVVSLQLHSINLPDIELSYNLTVPLLIKLITRMQKLDSQNRNEIN